MISNKKTAPKLKHLALKEIYYKLSNTSCIFTSNCWKYCTCDKFQGCRLKPLWHRLNGQQIYCYVCRVRVTYNAERIKKLTKIADIFNNYQKIKKDCECYVSISIQDVTNSGCIIIKLELEKLVVLISVI